MPPKPKKPTHPTPKPKTPLEAEKELDTQWTDITSDITKNLQNLKNKNRRKF